MTSFASLDEGSGGDGSGGGGGGDDDFDVDDDNLAITSPFNTVSDAVGPLFESEARVALDQVLREVCPWFDSCSPISTRFDMEFEDKKRQADLFSYCKGDSLTACSAVPEAGVYIVWPDASISAVVEPALPAASIKDEVQFSPADSSRIGPNKCFVGEAYSGVIVKRRRDKVHQLETEVGFLMRRFADRSGLDISDPTLVIGAAALVFPTEKGSQRRLQATEMLTLVRENLGPHLQRLARAGRLLLVLLSTDQAPQTYAQRDTALVLRQMQNALNLQARQFANQRKRNAQQFAKILQRLPVIHE